MKIQCNACEMAEATVLCCADEAALCLACDERIHAANKLASTHLRVPLSNSSQMPKCDICQETTGYFFCLEDRALLCRKCDVAIHTANAHVSAHQRFLLTGVKVGLEPKEPVVSSVKEKKNSREKASEIPSGTSKSRSLSSVNKDAASSQAVVNESLSASKVSFSGGSTSGFIPDWHLREFFGLNDFNNSYGLMEQVSSKGDGVKLGDSERSPVYPAVAEDVDIEDYLGQVPELPWTVPEIPSPPAASGLHWPRNIQCNLSDDSLFFVPDVCHLQNESRNQLHLANAIPSALPNPIPNPKRQRQF
ncbi:hypothetical protein AAC387_Pa06g0911 [Persea americana]